jgi:putative transposase
VDELTQGACDRIVERTFAWLGRYRRLKSDYERLPQTTEAIIDIAMIRLMARG